MQASDQLWDSDAQDILQYLDSFPDHYVSEAEIARRLGGKARFQEDGRWCRHALDDLLEAGLVLTDGYGKYRLKVAARSETGDKPKKFISPQMRAILENSSKPVDLSTFG